MNAITSVEEKRHNWYRTINKSDQEVELDEDIVTRLSNIQQKELELHDKELELKQFSESLEQKQKDAVKNNNVAIQQYIDTYKETNGRAPVLEEIYDHFVGSINAKYIDWFLTTDDCQV